MPKKKTIEAELIEPRKYTDKYQKWMDVTIVEIAEQGGHVAAMCKAIGVKSRDTFYRWVKEHKTFKDAYETSKLESQVFYEDILLAGALGRIKNYNFNSIAMTMNNKFSDEYTRSATGSNTSINIGSINTIEQMSGAELDKRIAQLQDKFQLTHDEDESD